MRVSAYPNDFAYRDEPPKVLGSCVSRRATKSSRILRIQASHQKFSNPAYPDEPGEVAVNSLIQHTVAYLPSMELQALTQFTNAAPLISLRNPSPNSTKTARGSSLSPTFPLPQRSNFWGQTAQFKPLNPQNHSHGGTPLFSIQCAISRNKKEETVEKVKKQLENCYLVAGIKYTGLTVKQLQELRKSLPESTKLVVAKNKLVGKAIEGTQWEVLKPCMKGMNAWMFVHSEEIPAALKPYRNFQKQQKLEENDFTGAVFEGKFYAPQEFKALETMPTRAEIYAKIVGSLQSPAIGLISTLQAPARDLVFTLKAYVQKLEEESGNASNS